MLTTEPVHRTFMLAISLNAVVCQPLIFQSALQPIKLVGSQFTCVTWLFSYKNSPVDSSHTIEWQHEYSVTENNILQNYQQFAHYRNYDYG